MELEAELKRIHIEKDLVRSALTRSRTAGTTWSALAVGWFENWKQYVDLDDQRSGEEPRSQERLRSLHPGPIDNEPLQGSYGDELKRGIEEGKDFVLLPVAVFDGLKKHYGGGPSFPRAVKNVGTSTSPSYKVILHPTRCEFYFCNAAHPEPSKNTAPSDKWHGVRYFTDNVSLSAAVEAAKQHCFPIYGGVTRLWLRDDEKEKTNTTDGWRLLRSDHKERLLDLLGDKDCLEILIEHCKLNSPKEEDWPRHKHLQSCLMNVSSNETDQNQEVSPSSSDHHIHQSKRRKVETAKETQHDRVPSLPTHHNSAEEITSSEPTSKCDEDVKESKDNEQPTAAPVVHEEKPANVIVGSVSTVDVCVGNTTKGKMDANSLLEKIEIVECAVAELKRTVVHFSKQMDASITCDDKLIHLIGTLERSIALLSKRTTPSDQDKTLIEDLEDKLLKANLALIERNKHIVEK